VWRPKNWVKDRNKFFDELASGKRLQATLYEKVKQRCYEAGADALLRALKIKGVKCTVGDAYPDHPIELELASRYTEGDKGYLVFILEEESNGKTAD